MKIRTGATALLLCLLLSACGGGTVPNAGNGPARSVTARAAGIAEEETILVIDGREIPAWQYLYWLSLACDNYRQEHGSFPDAATQTAGAAADFVKNQALSDTALYAAVEAMAERYGVTVEDGAAEALWRARCEANGGEAAYLKLLSRFGLDRERAMSLYRTGLLYGKLCALCAAGDGPQPDATAYGKLERESGEVRVDRLLAADADRNAARRRAVDWFIQLNGAEDQASLFAALTAQGDDPAGPRTLSAGTLDEKLTAAARSLEIGQLSGLVEAGDGVSILRRLPPERGPLLEKWLDTALEQAVSSSRTVLMDRYLSIDAGDFAEKLEAIRTELE